MLLRCGEKVDVIRIWIDGTGKKKKSEICLVLQTVRPRVNSDLNGILMALTLFSL